MIEQDVKNGFPGAVLLVMQNGEIIKRSAYGDARKYADGGALLPNAQKMRTDTLFDIASNTKMFATNLALIKLVSEGKLDVNAPIEQYMPDYQGGGRDTRLVRDFAYAYRWLRSTSAFFHARQRRKQEPIFAKPTANGPAIAQSRTLCHGAQC
ncbi:serine hydrolase [Paraglaciecola sp. Hal342]